MTDATDGCKPITVTNGERELRFDGVLLGEASSFGPHKQRWIELRLYRTRGGNYVLSGVGKTVLPGESDRAWAHVSETPQGVVESMYLYDEDNVRYLTNTAKRVLEQAGRVDAELRNAYLIEDVA